MRIGVLGGGGLMAAVAGDVGASGRCLRRRQASTSVSANRVGRVVIRVPASTPTML